PLADNAGNSTRAFRSRANLTLKGLYVTGANSLGAYRETNIIRTGADNVRIVLEDCHLDRDGQSAIRLDNKFCRVFVKKSIISNIGEATNLDNGRFIDARGVQQDSIWVENTTVYNITSRVYRVGDGGLSKFHYWNHNTIVNSAQHCLDIEQLATFIFTNNIVVNGAYFGTDTTTTPGSVPRTLIELDPPGPLLAGLSLSVTIRNNNFYLDPAISSLFPGIRGRKVVQPYDSIATAHASNTTMEAIAFVNGPPSHIPLVMAFLDTSRSMSSYPPFDTSKEPYDFKYPTTTAAYTGSTAGQPLGALTWFGLDIISAVKDRAGSKVPNSFRLLGNYPNPFNPSTAICFDLPVAAEVQIAVFDVTGRQVLATKPVRMNAGSAQALRLDASALATGVYFYRVTAATAKQTFTGTGDMLLVK
ncbi:MAG: T9SS type A sorting domain-containing protein, partial [candidate division KSB1 bacterium]|nr:T9SS type A sorting domain-containing protein [candidate division KSB1 bacterium]